MKASPVVFAGEWHLFGKRFAGSCPQTAIAEGAAHPCCRVPRQSHKTGDSTMTAAAKSRGDWTRTELCDLIGCAERLHRILDDGIRKNGVVAYPPKSNTAAWYRGDVSAALLELQLRIMPDCFHLRFTPTTPRRVYESLELLSRAADELTQLGFMRTDDIHVPDVSADVFTRLERGIAWLRNYVGLEVVMPAAASVGDVTVQNHVTVDTSAIAEELAKVLGANQNGKATEAGAEQAPEVKPPKRRRARRDPEGKKLILWEILRNHHGTYGDDDDVSYTPLTLAELTAKASEKEKMDETTVGRLLGTMFPGINGKPAGIKSYLAAFAENPQAGITYLKHGQDDGAEPDVALFNPMHPTEREERRSTR